MIRPDYIQFKELYHYGIPRRSGRYPWGSGDRPFQSTSPALSVYNTAAIKEKTITPDIKESAKESNSKLFGLENRLKSLESIERKINKKEIENGKTEKEAAESIHDSVRYTTISDTKNFVSSYEKFKNSMEKKGYTETECKNYFELFNRGIVKHKAVQSLFETKDGFKFEVQFQTPESQHAKTKKIPLYEERRKVGIDDKRARELESEMEKLALEIPDPPRIDEIKSHSSKDLKHSNESEVKFKMTNEIYHHGIIGMKWGVRRYQPYPKGYTGSGKEVGEAKGVRQRDTGISGYIRKKKQEKADAAAQKERNEQLRRAMEEEQKKRHHDADKERVLREGTATEVLKYQGELTNQELQNAVTRLNLESSLRGLSQRETKSAMDKVDEIMKTIKTGTEWAKIGTDTYNTFAAIYNATPEGQSKPLTLVGRGDGGKKK